MEEFGHAPMFGKWHLQVKLAKMAAYIEKRFTTSSTSTLAVPAKYPPTEEGMVQLVLAPTMQRIKAILPEQVDVLLTKEWIQKLRKDAENKLNVTVALSYLEYLICLQRDYEDMEKSVRAMPGLDITYPLSKTRPIPASAIPPAWDRHRGKSLSCLEMRAQGGLEYQGYFACIETFLSFLSRKTFP